MTEPVNFDKKLTGKSIFACPHPSYSLIIEKAPHHAHKSRLGQERPNVE